MSEAGARFQYSSDQSVLVYFDSPNQSGRAQAQPLQNPITLQANEKVRKLLRLLELERGEFGPDLAEVATLREMTAAQVIELHSSVEYLVYFLGFVPGFAYLGELPKELVTPRLAAPRRKVPVGSVGIAANHTGVYPFATPGGWRLLGRTPIKMFRADREGLSLLAIGDRVRFTPIDAQRFAALEREWA